VRQAIVGKTGLLRMSRCRLSWRNRNGRRTVRGHLGSTVTTTTDAKPAAKFLPTRHTAIGSGLS